MARIGERKHALIRDFVLHERALLSLYNIILSNKFRIKWERKRVPYCLYITHQFRLKLLNLPYNSIHIKKNKRDLVGCGKMLVFRNINFQTFNLNLAKDSFFQKGSPRGIGTLIFINQSHTTFNMMIDERI